MAEPCGLLGFDSYHPDTLDYVSASHGGWGIVRMAAQIPEAHLLFVCPSACGRHNALGSALFDLKDRVHYLFLDADDIIGGDLSRMIPENVDALFEILGFSPPALLIFTACIDDLMGTDHGPILEELHARHPETAFRHCTMNPISLDTPNPPGITTNAQMYSLLEKPVQPEKLRAVNLIGTNVAFRAENDLNQILRAHGYTVHHISDYERFADMQEMARSRLNILTSPISRRVAQEMEKKLGIPYLTAFVNYDPAEIADFYRRLSEALGEDFTAESEIFRERAERRIAEVQKLVWDYPVAIDYQAVLRPYTLAKMLIEHGFHVGMIASDGISKLERASYEALQKLAPELLIENPLDHKAVRFPHEGEKYLCIGFDCGYMTGSDKVSSLMEDTGLYAYDGIMLLMDEMEKAWTGGANVRQMIVDAGLII